MRISLSISAVVLAATCVIARPEAILAQGSVQQVAYVSVLDSKAAPVAGLGPSDFVIREDGVAREVLRVEPATDPMQIAVLIDNSVISQQWLTPLRQGVTNLVNALTEPMPSGGHNMIALIGLAERPTIFTDYTIEKKALVDGIGQIFPQVNSAAYLLDGVYETAVGFSRSNAPRPVMIVITGEGTDYSTRPRSAVLSALDRVDGLEFQSVTIGQMSDDRSDQAQDREVVLSQGTESHGGRNKVLLSAISLPSALTALAKELRAQYRVVYARPEELIPPSTITIAAAKPGMKAYGVPAKAPGPGAR
jgi:hypothetical protein